MARRAPAARARVRAAARRARHRRRCPRRSDPRRSTDNRRRTFRAGLASSHVVPLPLPLALGKVLFDTWPVVRRVLVIAAVALVGAGGFALTRQGSTPPPASHTDVYTQLAQQLKRHLQPLVVARTVIKNH